MRIGAILPQTLLDFPEKVSAVFFTLGCNFRCPFCYNKEAVFGSKELSGKEIENFLEERKNFLEAIVLSGGEPTIYPDLIHFIKKIRNKGYLIGLETNGTNPEILKELIKQKYLDFIAMDVKTSLSNYFDATKTNFSSEKIAKSISLIKKSKIKYEFRITAVPSLINKKTIKEIKNLLENAEKVVIQQFENDKELLDKTFEKQKPFSLEELQNFKEELSKSVKKVEIRAS